MDRILQRLLINAANDPIRPVQMFTRVKAHDVSTKYGARFY